MDKFLVTRGSQQLGSPSRSGHASRSSQGIHKSRPKQARLSQCKKVVKLKASRYAIDAEEVQALREVLDSATSTSKQLADALRHLDCLQLRTDELTHSKVGLAVKKLRKHSDPEISRYSRGIVDKWRRILLDECKR
jgi:hypothetical protein